MEFDREGLIENINIKPLTYLILAHAEGLAQRAGKSTQDIYPQAATEVIDLFGCVLTAEQRKELLRTPPVDLRSPNVPGVLSTGVVGGFLDCSIAAVTDLINDHIGYENSARITFLDTIERLFVPELGNGKLDGLDGDGRKVSLYDLEIEGDALRSAPWGLIRGLQECAADESANRTGLTLEDLQPMVQCWSAYDGPLTGEPATLDTTKPGVVFSSLEDGQRVSGAYPLTCQISDDIGVKRALIELCHPGTDEPIVAVDGSDSDVFAEVTVSYANQNAAANSTLLSSAVADGPADAVCRAWDLYGNRNSARRRILVDNDLGVVEVHGVSQDEVVEGTVSFFCRCADPETLCSLHRPSASSNEGVTVHPTATTEDGGSEVPVTWDTTVGLLDGEHSVVCQGESPSLGSKQATVSFFTNNYEPVCYEMDSSIDIVGAETYARPLTEDGRIGEILVAGDATDESGKSTLCMDANPQHLVLQMSGLDATYASWAFPAAQSFGNARYLLDIRHEPEFEAKTVKVYLSSASTAAVHTCGGIMATSELDLDVGQACETARKLWSTHINPDNPFDFRFVAAAPFDENFSNWSAESKALTLWEAGVEWVALSYGSRLRAPSLLELWAQDLTDGVFNERALAYPNSPIWITPTMPLSITSSREDIGRALLAIRAGAMPDGAETQATIGFTPTDVQSQAVGIAGDYSGLYGWIPEWELDVTAPLVESSIRIRQTGEDTVEICITVTDDSPIISAHFDFAVESQSFEDGLLCAEVNKSGYPEDEAVDLGDAVIVDQYHNRTVVDVTVSRLYNEGPILQLVEPAPNENNTLEGVVTFVINAIDDKDGVKLVRMTEPYEAEASLHEDGLYVIDVDSTFLPEGQEVSFEFVGEDNDGAQRTLTTDPYIIDNYDAGSLREFCSFADTAIIEADVEICWQEADGSCDPLDDVPALVTDSTGCVTVPLPDDRRGALRVRTRGGWYWSAVHQDDDGDPVQIYAPSDLGVTATYHYAPSRPATVLDGRRASYPTTWADAWADARLNANTTTEQMTEILDEGYRRLGLHPGRDLNVDGIDIRTTTPRDLTGRTSHSSATSEASTRLGIIQVSIAQCAATWSINNGSAPDALPSLTLGAEVIPQDATNLYYDGFDETGNRVTAMGQDLDRNTLRHTSMTCAALWLDSPLNRTTLRASNYSQPDGFFVVASANQDRELFGPLAGDFLVFDRTPPYIIAVLVGEDLEPLPLNPIPVDRAVSLRIDASDDGGLYGVEGLIRPVVSIAPGPSDALGRGILREVSPTALGITHAVYLGDLDEGEQTLQASQADATGNTGSAEPIRFVVDRTPPIITPNFPERTNTPVIEVSWSTNEALSEVAFYSGPNIVTTVTDGSMSASIDLGECNREFLMFLVAKDQAMNATTMPESAVVCDDTPPEFGGVEIPSHTNTTEVPIRWYTSEPMGSISILLDGEVTQTLDGTSREATVTLPSCESTHSIQLKGNDPAGNPGEGPVLTVTCETVAPNFSEFVVPENTASTAILAEWQVSETLRQLDIVLNDVVVASVVDGRTNYQISLPNCNEDFVLRAIATDPAGNVGQSQERGVTCDDIRPQITAHSVPALISGTQELAEMLISWSATEDISRLVFTIGDLDQTLDLDGSTESAVIPLPRCNEEFVVSMRAFDFSGNGSDPAGPDVVACDMYDPFVALMRSAHRQENELVNVCGVDSCELENDDDEHAEVIDLSQPVIHDIYHYKNRYYAGHEDMPFVEFQASDFGNVMTEDENIEVEYLYSGSDGDAFSEWRHLDRVPGTTRTYKIELSPGNLLPSIYDTDAEQLHTVTFRSRDTAGRYSEEVSVDFRLHFLSPPPVLSTAQLSDAITQRSLPDGNIHEFFTNSDSIEVLTMQVYWPWGHDNVPTHNAVLDLGAADMQPRVSEMRQNKYYTSGYYWVGDYSGWSCGSTGHRVGDGSCRPGLAPTSTIRRSGGETQHEMTYEVDGAVHLGLNRYEIEPNRAYTVRVGVRRPHVDIDGELYTWPQQNGVYEYTLEHGQEYTRRRYREDPDTGETILELYSRRFDLQTYISELVVEMSPITVDASVGDLPIDVVAATDHEECIGSWNYTTSSN